MASVSLHRNSPKKRELSELIADTALIDRAMRRASQQAVERHARNGTPISYVEDGKIVTEVPTFKKSRARRSA